ncbi:MAG: hypothetical protein P8H57_04725 [Emcibacteraceae bacterium]|nr:hypothetical protein [Emcibacteraceae bacterium]MDG1726435.1 hypothetical protein [Emcibacteraceae bacterium]
MAHYYLRYWYWLLLSAHIPDIVALNLFLLNPPEFSPEHSDFAESVLGALIGALKSEHRVLFLLQFSYRADHHAVIVADAMHQAVMLKRLMSVSVN